MENCTSTTGDYDRDDLQSLRQADYEMNGLNKEKQWMELLVNSEELTELILQKISLQHMMTCYLSTEQYPLQLVPLQGDTSSTKSLFYY
jgi:hypothetical protein